MTKNQKRIPVFHVPHDGDAFPKELMASVCVSKEAFLAYHERMRDTAVSEMVPQAWRGSENTLFFPISRLLCDVERFLGPTEPMERLGMGFCYERAFDGRPIKTVTEELRRKTLRYYRQHHDRLDLMCRRHSRVLLLDMHSFSDELVPLEQLRHGVSTPDVCLGVDEKYTPPELALAVERCLHEAGFTMMRNYPYSGSLVPNSILNGTSGCDCISIMLEWNKRTYCDMNGIPDSGKLEEISGIIRRIADGCADLE